MVRRRLIRSFSIALCVMLVAVWVGSYWRGVHMEYAKRGTSYCAITLEEDRIFFRWFPEEGNNPSYAGDFIFFRSNPADVERWEQSAVFECIGFSFDYADSNNWSDNWSFTIPLWFPALLSAIILWFAWRKKRPKLARGAFPIEPTTETK